MRTLELKVKIKSLAEEAKIIRTEEKKLPGPSAKRMELHEHRVGKVRHCARYALLAYGYLRGKPYRIIEAKCRKHNEPYAKLVESEIARFNGDFECEELYDAVRDWLKGKTHEIPNRNPRGADSLV